MADLDEHEMAVMPGGVRFARGAALTGWFALALQFYLTNALVHAQGRTFASTLFVYFGFFTILTNLLATSALSTIALKRRGTLASASVASGLMVSMIIVFLIYNVVLRPLYTPTGWSRVADELLHVVMPLAMVVYWWVWVAKASLAWRDALAWSVYPLLYLVYALVRGALSGSYPYPFIDVTQLGYPQVLVNSVGVTLLFLALAAICIAIGRRNARV